jgi:hypothetical protein
VLSAREAHEHAPQNRYGGAKNFLRGAIMVEYARGPDAPIDIILGLQEEQPLAR